LVWACFSSKRNVPPPGPVHVLRPGSHNYTPVATAQINPLLHPLVTTKDSTDKKKGWSNILKELE
jgi:hypothetical protein